MTGKGQVQIYAWSLGTLTHVPLSFADFNLYPLPVINCNREYNNFSEFCES